MFKNKYISKESKTDMNQAARKAFVDLWEEMDQWLIFGITLNITL